MIHLVTIPDVTRVRFFVTPKSALWTNTSLFAANFDMPVAVNGGGHDYASKTVYGYAMSNGELYNDEKTRSFFAADQDNSKIDIFWAGAARPIWAYSIVSGLNLLIKDNEITPNLDAFDVAPRTVLGFVGQKFYVLVAESGDSTRGGMTLKAAADYMRSLGCSDALSLDGGKSSKMIAENNESAPYAGEQAVCNHFGVYS